MFIDSMCVCMYVGGYCVLVMHGALVFVYTDQFHLVTFLCCVVLLGRKMKFNKIQKQN